MKNYTKKSNDIIMLNVFKTMADKSHSDYFTNINKFGQSALTAKALCALKLIDYYKGDSKKYVWIADYPTMDTVKLVKGYIKQNEKPKQKPTTDDKQQKIPHFVESMTIDTDDFDNDVDEFLFNNNESIELGIDMAPTTKDKEIDIKITERKTTKTPINHAKIVNFSYWLFSVCELKPNQVIDIIDVISTNSNKSEAILNLVVKHNILTHNIRDFISECNKFI